MNNKIIRSLWIGDRLSNNEIMCLNSFLYHGHEFYLYTYNNIQGLPDGVKIQDANTIIPASCIFRDDARSYASFADWFRMKLLFQEGGWWVDMDIICLQPFDIPEEYCFASEWHYSMKRTEVSNACVKSPSGALYLQQLIDVVEKKINSGETVKWGDVGVYLFRSAFTGFTHLHPYIKEPFVFCPFNYFNLSELICKNEHSPGANTLAIHLWNEIWRRGNLDKNAVYHPDSLYEKLKEKYLSPRYLLNNAG